MIATWGSVLAIVLAPSSPTWSALSFFGEASPNIGTSSLGVQFCRLFRVGRSRFPRIWAKGDIRSESYGRDVVRHRASIERQGSQIQNGCIFRLFRQKGAPIIWWKGFPRPFGPALRTLSVAATTLGLWTNWPRRPSAFLLRSSANCLTRRRSAFPSLCPFTRSSGSALSLNSGLRNQNACVRNLG